MRRMGMELPTVTDQYMSDGNNPKPVEDGQFPVLQLSDGGRYVGSVGQSFDEVRAEAAERGII
jgi:hypothetical protein